MRFRNGQMSGLESHPSFGLNYSSRVPVIVSTPNRVRDSISAWLGGEGYPGFIDLTMWTGQTVPGAHQLHWVDEHDDAYWRDKSWSEIWLEMLQGFERKQRSAADDYFILLLTPVAEWATDSEQNAERHCLWENRHVYDTFTRERGWEPERQIVIWQAGAIFYE